VLLQDAHDSRCNRLNRPLSKVGLTGTFYVGLQVGLSISAVFWLLLFGLLYAIAENDTYGRFGSSCSC
jgi:hypothetical protein